MTPPRLAVLISGSGTNLQALLNAIEAGELKAEPALVLSNREKAYGLVRAEKAGISAVHFPYAPFKGRGRAAYDSALAQKVAEYRPDLIVLAGFMRILTPAFLEHFPGRVINIHPALPGQFPGIKAVSRAFEAFKAGEITESGVMVHYVIPEVDAGPVIEQETVPIYPDDTPVSFEGRMHNTEHKLIVRATRKALERVTSNK